MSGHRTVDAIFAEHFSKAGSYASARKNPRYAKQVAWAEKTYLEQYDQEESSESRSDDEEEATEQDHKSVFEQLVAVGRLVEALNSKTESLEAALVEHRKEVQAVNGLFEDLNRSVAALVDRLTENKNARKSHIQ